MIANDRLYAAAVSKDGLDVVRELGTSERVYWEIQADATGDLIKAGDHLYSAGKSSITAIKLPESDGKPSIAWTLPVKGEIQRLLAANGKLIAITADGRLMAFGAVSHESIHTAKLEQATLHSIDRHLLVVRERALPGSADWTHQYGDIRNTVKSDDRLVKAPLGRALVRRQFQCRCIAAPRSRPAGAGRRWSVVH